MLLANPHMTSMDPATAKEQEYLLKNLNTSEGTPEGLLPDVPTLREPLTAEQLLSAVRPLLGKD